MTLIKNSPILSTLPQLFDDFLTRDLADWGFKNHSVTNTTIPSVNIIESNDGFTVEMAAPGMIKSDFTIELDNDILKISSKKEKDELMDENQRYVKREFSYESFVRTFHLTKTVVDDSKINAKYEHGILRIFIPKREEAKALPPRQIKIT